MTDAPTALPATIGDSARALLALIEADRAHQCATILGDATSRADALRAQAHAEARAQVRQAFAEQRLHWHERIAAARARLATQRRLHQQQHSAALLRLAWARLPGELIALWQAPATRAQWVSRVLESASARLPPGHWRIVHAPDWPTGERQALALSLAAGMPTTTPAPAPLFEADAGISAGLKVLIDGNVVDGTLAGLLAERADFEARLLRRLEGMP